MPFPIVIKVLETKPPDVTVRNWRSITKGTYRAIGRHWYANMLPNHFKANAANVYGYRQRSKDYLEQKRKAAAAGRSLGRKRVSAFAATMSLTVSGTLHRAMTASGVVIKAYPTRFTVKMPGLPYTPSRQRSSKQPFLQKELTTLLKREIDVLKGVGKEAAKQQLAKLRASRRTVLQ
ncbi:MAG: hypothetical protein ABJZ55_02015 [Fuerstiella sp.]